MPRYLRLLVGLVLLPLLGAGAGYLYSPLGPAFVTVEAVVSAGLGVFLVVLLVSRWVALGSVLAALSVAVLALVAWARHDEALSGRLLVWACTLAAIVIFRHRANFLRRLGSH